MKRYHYIDQMPLFSGPHGLRPQAQRVYDAMDPRRFSTIAVIAQAAGLPVHQTRARLHELRVARWVHAHRRNNDRLYFRTDPGKWF